MTVLTTQGLRLRFVRCCRIAKKFFCLSDGNNRSNIECCQPALYNLHNRASLNLYGKKNVHVFLVDLNKSDGFVICATKNARFPLRNVPMEAYLFSG
jgi:hypothetical protein